ncbi:MAG: nitroreductase family protein [Phycisphaerae bacterium]|nr:nitroreductase family protein [Phycisphaerae bacterium]
MTLLETIKKRYSCRNYIDKPIENEKTALIFEAARLAPSAKNLQDWRFVAVTEPYLRKKIAHAANDQVFLENAAMVLVACSNAEYVMACGQHIGAIDVSIALEHIALQATELGIGTCWIGSFDPKKVKKILSIPDDIMIVDLMAIGYSADTQRPAQREPLENILCYNNWKF